MFRKTAYRLGGVGAVGTVIVLLAVLAFFGGLAGCVTVIGAPLGASLIGGSVFWGIVGMLLSLKKKVLQCNNRKCRATVAAS